MPTSAEQGPSAYRAALRCKVLAKRDRYLEEQVGKLVSVNRPNRNPKLSVSLVKGHQELTPLRHQELTPIVFG